MNKRLHASSLNGERTAESKKKEALLEAKEEIHKLRSDVERENKDRRSELQRMERRILQKRRIFG